MHDLEFEHVHVENAEETRAVREAIWAADNVELTTVGIDIGSSTSHLMFARVHLSRLATGLSSRFVVVERKVLWQSPILLTPYLPDFTIDTASSPSSSTAAYAEAELDARQGRQRRGDPDRRGAEAEERARHRRSVSRRVRKVRLRLRRPSHGMPAGRARLRRREALEATTARRCSTSTSAAAPPSWRSIRDGEIARDGGDRGRRPADRGGAGEGPHPHRGAGARGGQEPRHRAASPARRFRPTTARGWSRA